jgi:hypothetical protein
MMEKDDRVLPELDDLSGAEDKSNPIPAATIGLADAYFDVLCAITPNLGDLYDQVERTELEMLQYEHETGNEPDHNDFNWALDGIERAQRQAQQFFRRSLVAQELAAYVQIPETGEFVPLGAAGWEAADPSLLGGILDDYGGTMENPSHPEAMVGGVRFPVFFLKKDFDRWLKRTFPQGGGRPRGSGMQIADLPLLREMHQLILAGQASSPTDAARQVVDKAIGGGGQDSKIRRLERHYKVWRLGQDASASH